MKGEGIRADFTVTESDDEPTHERRRAAARSTRRVANYAAYVQDQSDQLLAKTEQFVELYKSGDDDAARTLYPDARTHWERIETVAESFGDLDPKMDAREADLEPGQKWTGWHQIEKDLWPERAENYTPLTDEERATYADDLLANTQTLDKRVADARPTPSTRSPTARAACSRRSPSARSPARRSTGRTPTCGTSRPTSTAPGSATRASSRSSRRRTPSWPPSSTPGSRTLQTLLDAQRVGDGFKTYDELTPDEVKAALRRGQRAVRAAVQAHRRCAVLT